MLRIRRKRWGVALFTIALMPYLITIFLNGISEETGESFTDSYCILRLAQEVSEDYEDEMLKAQAVLVRTTVYQELQENQGQLDFTHEEIQPEFRRRLKKAWEDTHGQVLFYQDKMALVPFHRLSNGRTRTGKEVLGTDEYPYLVSVECPKDVEADEQIQTQMIDVQNVKVSKTDSAGYVSEVTVGEEKVPGEQFRSTYKLSSGAFILQSAGERTRVTTSGVGHGLGLSQHTANEMAKTGKTYKEILEYFFAGTTMKEVAEVLINVE